jgi:hypothetical protein
MRDIDIRRDVNGNASCLLVPIDRAYVTWSPSTNQAQGHPIIEREGITVIRCDDDYGKDEKGYTTLERIPVWAATNGQFGTTCTTEHQSA